MKETSCCPECGRWPERLPAYGSLPKHVEEMRMSNIQCKAAIVDLREALQMEPDDKRTLATVTRELLAQREALWMLLDHIDTLDDSSRDNDLAFRHNTRKYQKQRWEIWSPEATGTQSVCNYRIDKWGRSR